MLRLIKFVTKNYRDPRNISRWLSSSTYGSTLNLPQTSFPLSMKGNVVTQRERQIQQVCPAALAVNLNSRYGVTVCVFLFYYLVCRSVNLTTYTDGNGTTQLAVNYLYCMMGHRMPMVTPMLAMHLTRYFLPIFPIDLFWLACGILKFNGKNVGAGLFFFQIMKDITNRYKLLHGYRVHYIPGWDCHGTPIEQKALAEIRSSEYRKMNAIDVRNKGDFDLISRERPGYLLLFW